MCKTWKQLVKKILGLKKNNLPFSSSLYLIINWICTGLFSSVFLICQTIAPFADFIDLEESTDRRKSIVKIKEKQGSGTADSGSCGSSLIMKIWKIERMSFCRDWNEHIYKKLLLKEFDTPNLSRPCCQTWTVRYEKLGIGNISSPQILQAHTTKYPWRTNRWSTAAWPPHSAVSMSTHEITKLELVYVPSLTTSLNAKNLTVYCTSQKMSLTQLWLKIQVRNFQLFISCTAYRTNDVPLLCFETESGQQ